VLGRIIPDRKRQRALRLPAIRRGIRPTVAEHILSQSISLRKATLVSIRGGRAAQVVGTPPVWRSSRRRTRSLPTTFVTSPQKGRRTRRPGSNGLNGLGLRNPSGVGKVAGKSRRAHRVPIRMPRAGGSLRNSGTRSPPLGVGKCEVEQDPGSKAVRRPAPPPPPPPPPAFPGRLDRVRKPARRQRSKGRSSGSRAGCRQSHDQKLFAVYVGGVSC